MGTLKVLTLWMALYADSCGRVRVYGKFSPEFSTSSEVWQISTLFRFHFVIDLIMESSLPASLISGFELLPGCCLTDIEYTDDIAPM